MMSISCVTRSTYTNDFFNNLHVFIQTRNTFKYILKQKIIAREPNLHIFLILMLINISKVVQLIINNVLRATRA